MKLLTITTLIALSISSLGSTALAETGKITKISPANLISGAYQGRFIDKGIPSNSAFLTAVRGKRVEAEDLIAAAISSGRLSVTII